MAKSASAQVYWNADYDSVFPFCSTTPLIIATNGGIAPSAGIAITNNGGVEGNFLSLNADASQCSSRWAVWCRQTPCTTATVRRDILHVHLKFDAWVSKPRPLQIRLVYQADWPGGALVMFTQVQPTITNAFQTFLLPFGAFSWYFNNGSSAFPTAFDFGMIGDPASPETTWPSAPDNMVAVDNVSYIIEPILSMTVSGQNVTLSWPTNTTGFVLQQTVDLSNWVAVTNAPLLTNGVNQVVVSPVGPQTFFRLLGP
jgi:hypothetical protein